MIARLAARSTAAVVLLTLSVGVPVMLAAGIGWPLPASLPSWNQATVVLTSPPSGRLVLNTVAVLCWILWAAFISQVAADLAWLLRHGLRRPDRHTPLRGFTFALLAALLSGTFGTTAAVVAPLPGQLVDAVPVATAAAHPGTETTSTTDLAPPRQAEPIENTGRRTALWQDAPTILPDPAATGTVLVQVSGDRHTVDVAEGDTLWDLAQAWLGDPARWPEIEALNRDRYPMHGGGHIEPDWVLVLPDDAAQPGTEPAEQAADAEDPDGQPGLVHEVASGDWMWHIADRHLGDPERYPEIAALNPDLNARYDNYPDHIEPGDELLLPADARDRGPRHHATGDVTPVDQPPAPAPPNPEPAAPPPEPPATGSPTPQPSPPSPAAPPDPDGVVPDPAATPTPTPGPTPTAGEPTTSPTAADPSPGPGAAGEDADDQRAGEDGDGVLLGDGSWIPWAVATAIAAAMAVVWLQRRRRYRPRRLGDTDADSGELYLEEDPDPAALDGPATVARIRRALRLHSRSDDVPHTGPEPEPVEPAPAPGPGPQPESDSGVAHPVLPAGVGPDQQQASLQAAAEPLPAGGTAIVGPGAEAAARGALVAALSAGAPVDPDAQTEVVVPAEVMVTLLGADAVTLGTWRRLRVTPDLDAALAVLEARLLATARLLDEYETEDLAALRAAAPAERPVPPLLLIAAAPEAEARMRTRNALGLGRGVGVCALLLGQWRHGPTVQVDTDGTCRPTAGGDLPAGIPPRMMVLDQQAAFELLATLREAHTGHAAPAAAGPAPAAPATEAPATTGRGEDPVHDERKTTSGRDDAPSPAPEPAEPAPAPSTSGEETGQQEPPAGVPTARARVLGTPEIEGWQQAGRPLRKAAVELLVHLACHPDGATPDRIQEDMWPDSRRRLAATKLHTAASNLRHLLAAAAGADDAQAGAYVRKDQGRYRIPAGPVEVDLWTLRAECDRASRATDPGQRVAALRRAVAAYRGELAAGRDYEWVTGHREAARALALDAHTTLAGLVADDDPGEAARLLLAAVAVDPMAEAVYRQAMRACHRIGDAETIRNLLRQLAGQLEVVGGEPADETIELAEKLRAELNQRPGSALDT